MAAALPDTPALHKLTEILDDASFPFDDITLTGNVIPASTLQHLMPPLQVHMNLNYPYEDHQQSSSENSEDENEMNHFTKAPKHDPSRKMTEDKTDHTTPKEADRL